LGGRRDHSICRSAFRGFTALGRSRPFFAAVFTTWPASLHARRIRVVMPWRLRFTRRLARFAAIRARVLSYRHPDFIVCELGSCSYCLLHSGTRSPLAPFHAVTGVAGCHFQQFHLVSGTGCSRDRTLTRTSSRWPFLSRTPALAPKRHCENHGTGSRRGRGCSFADAKRRLAVRLRQRSDLPARSSRILARRWGEPPRWLVAYSWRFAPYRRRNGIVTRFSRRSIDNPAPDRSAVHQRLQRLFQQREIKPNNLVAGDSFRLSGEVTGHVLFPPRVVSASIADDQTYVVQLFIPPSTSILFMSDSGLETERALLAYGLDLHSDIVVKGQHHSGQSGTD